MQTIPEILRYPNATPIEAVQARIAQVYEYRNQDTKYGKKTVQSIVLEDGAGNKIRATLWEHPDLTEHKGKEYVFSGGRGGKGIQVKHDSYIPKGKTEAERVKTVELSIGKAGTLQFIEVHHAQAGTKPAEPVSRAVEAPKAAREGEDARAVYKPAYTPINGAKVGMALNNAVLLLTATGDSVTMDKVKQTAIEIIRLSNDLESGRIVIDAPAERPAASTPEQKAANQVDKQGRPILDEDVPF